VLKYISGFTSYGGPTGYAHTAPGSVSFSSIKTFDIPKYTPSSSYGPAGNYFFT
jgi:hypothetical protein